jgi:Ca2+-binding EF-hand superfamily protein
LVWFIQYISYFYIKVNILEIEKKVGIQKVQKTKLVLMAAQLPTSKSVEDKEKRTKMFNEIDANESGKISFREVFFFLFFLVNYPPY